MTALSSGINLAGKVYVSVGAPVAASVSKTPGSFSCFLLP